MRNRLRLPALAFVAILAIGACSPGAATSRAERGDTVVCRSSGQRTGGVRRPVRVGTGRGRDAGARRGLCPEHRSPAAMQMWERSGGNKGMVDMLVVRLERREPGPSRST